MKVKATYTKDYRSNAKCARTHKPLSGEAVKVILSQTGEKTRYLSREVWESETTEAEAASVFVGKQNRNGLRYQCVIHTPNASVELHASMLAQNGNAPLWYATPNGYSSPNFANAKWHDKLTKVFELINSATVSVIITDEATGAVVGVASVSGKRDELGHYVKKDERGKSPLMHKVDAITVPVKGYSNYNG